MQVLRLRGENSFCGPAALSAIAGITTGEGAFALRQVTGASRIKGVHNHSMVQALRMLGYRAEPLDRFLSKHLRPTVAGWLKTTALSRNADTVYLINITGHYLVLKGRKIYDNKHPEGVFLRHYPHRRMRVKFTFAVQRSQELPS